MLYRGKQDIALCDERNSKYNTNRTRSGAVPLLRNDTGNVVTGFNLGSSTANGRPFFKMHCFKKIFIALDISIPSWANNSTAHFFEASGFDSGGNRRYPAV